MIFKLNLYSFFVFFLFVSCGQKRVSDSYVLESANKFISFEIDEVTKMPQNSIFSFTDAKGSDFISFQNDNNPEILIYAVQSGDLEKKIKFSTEGSHAIVGGFFGYYIQDFNQIFIPSLYTNTIHVTDTSGLIKQQISYPQTDSGQQLIPFVSNSRAQMCFSDNKIYIPQTLNRMLKDRIIEDSPVGAVIDTVGHHIEALPMRFPKLITKEDIGTSVAFGVEYSRCFDGKTFVYAFFFEEKLYQATPDHKEVKMSIAKSRYIDEVKIVKPKNQQQFSDKLFPPSVLSSSNINAQTLLTTCSFISPTCFSYITPEFLLCLILAFTIQLFCLVFGSKTSPLRFSRRSYF